MSSEMSMAMEAVGKKQWYVLWDSICLPMPIYLHSTASWHSNNCRFSMVIVKQREIKKTGRKPYTLAVSSPISQKASFGWQIPWYGGGSLLKSLFTLQWRNCRGPMKWCDWGASLFHTLYDEYLQEVKYSRELVAHKFTECSVSRNRSVVTYSIF